MLNEAHVIEMTKACTVTFMKARNNWLFDVERKVSVRKKREKMVRIYFFKSLANRFRLTSKLIDHLLLNGKRESESFLGLRGI